MQGLGLLGFMVTHRLHGGSFLGLPYKILNPTYEPLKGTTMEPMGSLGFRGELQSSHSGLDIRVALCLGLWAIGFYGSFGAPFRGGRGREIGSICPKPQAVGPSLAQAPDF